MKYSRHTVAHAFGQSDGKSAQLKLHSRESNHLQLLVCLLNLPPADGAFARQDITFAVIQAEVLLQITDALTREAVHAQVAGVAHALGLPRPLVDHAPGELVTGLELAGIGPVTWETENQDHHHGGKHLCLDNT